jgi:hypothetical protein
MCSPRTDREPSSNGTRASLARPFYGHRKPGASGSPKALLPDAQPRLMAECESWLTPPFRRSFPASASSYTICFAREFNVGSNPFTPEVNHDRRAKEVLAQGGGTSPERQGIEPGNAGANASLPAMDKRAIGGLSGVLLPPLMDLDHRDSFAP